MQAACDGYTRATINAVRSDFVCHMKLEPSSIECFALANDDCEVPLREVTVLVKWEEKIIEVKLVIFNNLYRSLILGTGIAAADAEVYFNKGEILARRKKSDDFQNFFNNRPAAQE